MQCRKKEINSEGTVGLARNSERKGIEKRKRKRERVNERCKEVDPARKGKRDDRGIHRREYSSDGGKDRVSEVSVFCHHC
jgi:hypothetical protein